MRIRYTEHVTNEAVLKTVSQQRKLLGRVKARKLAYFGHIVRHAVLEHDIMLVPVPGTRRQGGQRRQWLDDLTQWTGMRLPELVRTTEDRDQYRRLIHSASYAPNGVW